MNDSTRTYETIVAWLDQTLDEEIDCDQFTELLAPWLDDRITEPRVLELIEHHRRLCGECAEQVATLRRALDLEET